MSKVVILMASKGDLEWSQKIADSLQSLGVATIMRIASAHKVPLKCLEIIKENEAPDTVFITVAGRSNALSGFSDGQTTCPVIACPPYSDKYGGNDIYSSLSMPSGIGPMTVTDPGNAALAAAKILAVKDDGIREKISAHQEKNRQILVDADASVSKG